MDARFAQRLMQATRGRALIHQDVAKRLKKAEAYLAKNPGHKGAQKAADLCKQILSGGGSMMQKSLQRDHRLKGATFKMGKWYKDGKVIAVYDDSRDRLIFKSVTETPKVSREETERLARKLGISLKKYSLDQLHMGVNVELEHKDLLKHDDDRVTAMKIATEHLDEYADYYTRLKKVEKSRGGASDPWLGQSRASKNAELRASGQMSTKPSRPGSRGGGYYGYADFPDRAQADNHATHLNSIDAKHNAAVFPHPKGGGFVVTYTRQATTPKPPATAAAVKPTKSSI